MEKIPFDIKLWPEIESGRYKVVTEHGEPVEIVKWDCKGKYPILAVINDGDTDDSCFFGPDGTSPSSKEKLFILTDEPEELTEFEQRIKQCLAFHYGIKFADDSNDKLFCCMILHLAQKELENSDWIKDIREWCYNKGHLEGYAKGQEDAEKRFRESEAYHFNLKPNPYYPPCFRGGPCINPHHDCINCPQQGTSGIANTDTELSNG